VVVPKPSNEELPVFDKPSKDPPIAGEPSKGYNLNDDICSGIASFIE
jgi:hypothetical protein